LTCPLAPRRETSNADSRRSGLSGWRRTRSDVVDIGGIGAHRGRPAACGKCIEQSLDAIEKATFTGPEAEGYIGQQEKLNASALDTLRRLQRDTKKVLDRVPVPVV